jgi:ribosome-binding protein aMBF1 (putative translation factor)
MLRRMARRSAAYRLFLTRLRQARMAAGLTQQQVAAKLRRPRRIAHYARYSVWWETGVTSCRQARAQL